MAWNLHPGSDKYASLVPCTGNMQAIFFLIASGFISFVYFLLEPQRPRNKYAHCNIPISGHGPVMELEKN